MTDADLEKTQLMAESRAWRQTALVFATLVGQRLLHRDSPERAQFLAELQQAFADKLARHARLAFPGRPAVESNLMADMFHEEWTLAARSITAALDEED